MTQLAAADYIHWLYSQTGLVPTRNLARSYWSLIRSLHQTPFFWTVHNDGNREADAQSLRAEFLEDFGISDDSPLVEAPASVLEVLIGVSRRLAFQAGGEEYEWFWTLLTNLEIDMYADNVFDSESAANVEYSINRFLNRDYNEDGSGGLFPLRYPRHNQRRVEIWYQMAAYLLEGNEPNVGP